MPFLTEDQAAAEVSKWKIEYKGLKPALVTREDLWKSYKDTKGKNSEWAAEICELGVSAATVALTSSATFNILDWVADAVTEVAKTKAVETAFGTIAGVYLTDYEEGKNSYELTANKKFATKLVSGFLTILVSVAAGGTLAVTGGGAAVVTAIAIIVWIGEREEAKERRRWNDIVNSTMDKYAGIREKKLQQINAKHLNELERMVMSNAQHDLEDEGLVKTYKWKSGNQIIIMRYKKSGLEQLLERMKIIDRGLGDQLRIDDLLEITLKFPNETKALWDHSAKNFDEAKMKAFMQERIKSHAGPGKVPMTKVEQKLQELREQALWAADKLDDTADYHETMNEGGVASAPKTSTPKSGAI